MKFHGHLCPMFYLGLRMGELALRELGRSKEEGAKLIAQVEYRNCMADGIQYVCGTTYGKNNLAYLDHGKFAVSFHDFLTGKKIRIRVKNEVLQDALAYGLRGQKVKSMPVGDRQKMVIELFKMGSDIIANLKKKPDVEIFVVEAGEELKLVAESPLELVICEECGEALLKDFSDFGRCRRCQMGESEHRDDKGN